MTLASDVSIDIGAGSTGTSMIMLRNAKGAKERNTGINSFYPNGPEV